MGAIRHAISNETLRGPVNLVAPNPVTNAEFAATLGRALHRPTFLPTPMLPLKVKFGGELVQSLLLSGQRAQPAKLQAAGYEFTFSLLDHALRALVHA